MIYQDIRAMSKDYFDEQTYRNIDFRLEKLPNGEYTDCQFIQCSFENVNLSSLVFTDCEFIECDLSNAKLGDTSFRNVLFKQCKMLGLHFHDCREFLLQMAFDYCLLNYATFHHLNLSNTKFRHCECKEVDFEKCNLTNASFEETDLSGAIFQNSNLTAANFTSAINFSINTENNILKKAYFSRYNISGLINHLNINLK